MEVAAQKVSKIARKHLRNTWVHRLPITSWTYKKLIHFSVPVEERRVLFRDKEIWVNTKDTSMVPSIISGDYEAFELEVFQRRILKRGMNVLDIGANMGIYSVLAADVAKNVYAFEPVPENLSLLRKTIKLNDASNVKIIPAAVGEKDGSIAMHIVPGSLGTHGVFAESEETIEVKVVSIDNFVKKNRLKIDLIKIDVEGYEPYALKGAEKTISEQRPIIFMEFNSKYIKNSGADPLVFSSELFSIYKYRYLLNEKKKKLIPIDAKEASRLINENLILSTRRVTL